MANYDRLVPHEGENQGRAGASGRQEAVRRQLLDLFLAEGFQGLNLDDIARRLKCSKSTLYAIAPSKEQLITTVVRAFFREATEHIDERMTAITDLRDRIPAYLAAISVELAPGSPAFFADVEAHAPAREIYRHNTAVAADHVRAMVAEVSGTDSPPAAFVGAVVGQTMESIHAGRFRRESGLSDADAYKALAALVVHGIQRSRA